MAYPFPARKAAQPPLVTRATIPSKPTASNEWRCLECSKLLGIRRGSKLHIRVHGHDYAVNLPVETICRRCGIFNRT